MTKKEFVDMFLTDCDGNRFTTKEVIVYGVVYPLALILLCGIAESISNI